MLCKQASLEASNDALSRQAAANAANADLVEKVKKEAKVGIFIVLILSKNHVVQFYYIGQNQN